MSLPQVASREQWLVARKRLLAREKELTRQRDTLNADRRRLPMVRIDKYYKFEGERGKAGLLDMFGESSQLIIRHSMWDPEWDKPCAGCADVMDAAAPALFESPAGPARCMVRTPGSPKSARLFSSRREVCDAGPGGHADIG